ncbi:MAG: type II toxin-antitoxin system VapC family toxin [Reyranella sp.]|uniref:type II toxin-antitoxin system VapC family toxin n=1 Tax=Reyranella sp. TaxID=1929291 RepID=UPI001AD1CE0D|nr:type II toxin-antitoxin system VapC family toxin [Reyranella sp.]MBN9090391.1 type II toxin-antitoxin system VapC family toxin [Reyranella sp.]
MSFLLDTNVVSELRRRRPHGAVTAWLRATDHRLLSLSAFSLGEIQAGIELTRDQDPGRAAELERWADEVARTYEILPMDAAVWRTWAKLMHHKSDTLADDARIAATALVHGLIIVTRNVRDFQLFDVQTFNPFTARP